MVTRRKRVAGIAGRIAAPPWKKNQKFTGQLCKAVGSSSGLDEQRGSGNAKRSSMCPWVPLWVSCPLHPPCHTHPPVAGLVGSCVTHVCDCPCLQGCWCAGCSQAALWMLILYLIYSRKCVVQQMRFAEGPKNGQIFAWSHFPCCIRESPSLSLGPGRYLTSAK